MIIRAAAAIATIAWFIAGAAAAHAQAPPTGGGTVSITAGPTWTHGVGNRSATTSAAWAPNPGFTVDRISIEVYRVVIDSNGVRTETLAGIAGQSAPVGPSPWNNVKIPFPSAGLHCVKVRLRTIKVQPPGGGTVYEDIVQSADTLIN